jgi:hypothetical protein
MKMPKIFLFRLALCLMFLVGQVAFVCGQQTDSAEGFTEIDTSAFRQTNSAEENTVSEEEEPTEEDEGEEEATQREMAIRKLKYDSLLQNAAHVRYDTVRNQVAFSHNTAGWKSETSGFDFTEHPPKKKDKKPEKVNGPFRFPDWNLGWLAPYVKYGSLILLIGLLVWLISMVVKQYISEPELNKDDLLSWEVNPDKISYDKLEELLQTYLRENNHRQALRILFLMVLKDLSTMELIVWKKNKTNYDYLRELKDTGVQLPYRRISMAFDAARYGNYTVNETSFLILKGHFDAIQKAIKPTIPAS